MSLREMVLAGLGEIKADTVLKDCRIVNVNTKEITSGDIAIKSGFIAGIGDVSGLTGPGTVIVDIKNSHVCPGLIDGHLHFESSMITLTRFAEMSAIHGTTGLVIDPHEIANILGRKGIRLVMQEAKKLPVDVFFTISSCVPSSPFETPGAQLGISEVKKFLDKKFVVGLGEVMDYPGILQGNKEKLSMISAALEEKLVADGHCPGLGGKELFAYMSAGISSDHEPLTYEELIEKARLGMKLILREGSVSKNMEQFIPRLLEDGISLENFFLGTDDQHPSDIIKGHMDILVRHAIELGIEPVQAISMCTINTARHYRIDQLTGSLSIGRRANIIILDDLPTFSIRDVMIKGEMNPGIYRMKYPGYVFRTVKYRKTRPDDLKITSNNKKVQVHVIDVIPGQLVTGRSTAELNTINNTVIPDTDRDILAVAVIERHGKSGNIGHGFVKGFNLKEGAVGQSIAHDSHNVITIGTNFEDMALCINKIKELQGGIVIAKDGIIDYLQLPFAGILSIKSAGEVDMKFRDLHGIIRKMGCTLDSPFMQLSFLSLPVIPELKITDMGLVDVNELKIIDPLQVT